MYKKVVPVSPALWQFKPIGRTAHDYGPMVSTVGGYSSPDTSWFHFESGVSGTLCLRVPMQLGFVASDEPEVDVRSSGVGDVATMTKITHAESNNNDDNNNENIGGFDLLNIELTLTDFVGELFCVVLKFKVKRQLGKMLRLW